MASREEILSPNGNPTSPHKMRAIYHPELLHYFVTAITDKVLFELKRRISPRLLWRKERARLLCAACNTRRRAWIQSDPLPRADGRRASLVGASQRGTRKAWNCSRSPPPSPKVRSGPGLVSLSPEAVVFSLEEFKRLEAPGSSPTIYLVHLKGNNSASHFPAFPVFAWPRFIRALESWSLGALEFGAAEFTTRTPGLEGSKEFTNCLRSAVHSSLGVLES